LSARLRIPTPRILFYEIVGKFATDSAEHTGLLYSTPYRYRNDLLQCASIIKDNYRVVTDDQDSSVVDAVSEAQETHSKIARVYLMLYKDSTGDPRWIRESYYHSLTSGNSSELSRFGNLYGSELLWAGQMWFKFRKYEATKEALLAAENLGIVTYDSRRTLASCLIRLRNNSEGNHRYQTLIKDYPNLNGPETSHVDALLSIGENQKALKLLESYSFTVDSENAWIIGQFGRAYMGLHRYSEAVQAFLKQLAKYQRSDAIIYIRIAQCFFRLGERNKAAEILKKGLKNHKTHPGLITLYCANLIQENQHEKLQTAEDMLDEVLVRFPHNAYALLKGIKIYEITNRPNLVNARLNEINWQVQPENLTGVVKVAANIAKEEYESALKQLEEISVPEDYREALYRSINLSRIRKETEEDGKVEIAKNALKRPLPKRLMLSNIPLLEMQAQLSKIAKDDQSLDKCIENIEKINKSAAEIFSQGLDGIQIWDDIDSFI
ncbi:MAG: hypothetical protein KAR13_20825, partial [Desulfobulbaceae bacterium]|nr:hypothetical protein [Desulfobulbaceae bacterium]